MRHVMVATMLLLAACGDSATTTENDAGASLPPADESASAANIDNQLIANPNGTQTLRLEGNDTATFVDGELVDVNRAN